MSAEAVGVPFLKGHGTGNDFVLLPDPDGTLQLPAALVREICDRGRGIGADGILRVVRTAAVPEAAALATRADWFMDYRNADGSAAEMCGNGIRVYARYLTEAGLVPGGPLRLATRNGIRELWTGPDGEVTVDLGPAALPRSGPVSVTVPGRGWRAVSVDMGNPHAVVVVSALSDAGTLAEAPTVAPGTAYPDGANVEFVAETGPMSLAMRVFERGVGETRSCGTGACAAVAAVMHRRAESGPAAYRVDVPGGTLRVDVRADGHLLLSGPAVIVAQGELRPDWVRAASRDLSRQTDGPKVPAVSRSAG